MDHVRGLAASDAGEAEGWTWKKDWTGDQRHLNSTATAFKMSTQILKSAKMLHSYVIWFQS